MAIITEMANLATIHKFLQKLFVIFLFIYLFLFIIVILPRNFTGF